jgi:uncharacterized protein YoxC
MAAQNDVNLAEPVATNSKLNIRLSFLRNGGAGIGEDGAESFRSDETGASSSRQGGFDVPTRRAWLQSSVAAIRSGADLFIWGAVGTAVWLGGVYFGMPALIPGMDLNSVRPLEAVALLAIASLPPAVGLGVLAGRRRSGVAELFASHLSVMDNALGEMELRSKDLQRLSATSAAAAMAACENLQDVTSRLNAAAIAAATSSTEAESTFQAIDKTTRSAKYILEEVREAARLAQTGSEESAAAANDSLNQARLLVRDLLAVTQASQAASREFLERRDSAAVVFEEAARIRETALTEMKNLQVVADTSKDAATALRDAATQQYLDLSQARNDVTRAVAETSDAVRQQSAQLNVGARRAVEAAEEIKRILDNGTISIEAAGESLRAHTSNISADLRGAVEQLQATTDALIGVKRRAGAEARQLTDETNTLVAALNKLASTIVDGDESTIRRAAAAVKELEGSVDHVVGRLMTTASNIRKEAEGTSAAVSSAVERSEASAKILSSASVISAEKAEKVSRDVAQFTDSIESIGKGANDLSVSLNGLGAQMRASQEGMQSLAQESGGLTRAARTVGDESMRLVAAVEDAIRRVREVEGVGEGSIGRKLVEISSKANATADYVVKTVAETNDLVDSIGGKISSHHKNFADYRDQIALIGETVRLQVEGSLDVAQNYISRLDRSGMSLVKAIEVSGTIAPARKAEEAPLSDGAIEMRRLGERLSLTLKLTAEIDVVSLRQKLSADSRLAGEALKFATAVADYAALREPHLADVMNKPLGNGMPSSRALYDAIRAVRNSPAPAKE